jgi:hypothetical protein
MATNKRKREICMNQTACDGNEIPPNVAMCGKCQQAMDRKKRRGSTDARLWAVRNN